MRMTLAPQQNAGYALVIVMGLLAILTLLALSLGAATRADLAQTRRFQDETAAELLAKAGIEWATHYVHTMERQGALWQAPWASQAAMFQKRALGPGTFDVQYSDASGVLHYGLQDEEARVHLNIAPVALLAALPGIGKERAAAIATHRQQTPWGTPEELLHHGLVSVAEWYGSAGQTGLQAYVTVWGTGKINVNTASPGVLAALPGMTPALVETIIRYRQGDDRQLGTADDRYFRAITDLLNIQGMDRSALERFGDMLTVTPRAFRCIVTGQVRSGTGQVRRQQRLAVLERTADATALRYWRRLE